MLLTLYIVFIALLVGGLIWAITSEDDITAWIFCVVLAALLMISSYGITETWTVVNQSITNQSGTIYTTTYTNSAMTNTMTEPPLFYFWMAVTAICIIAGVVQTWQFIQKRKRLA